MTNKRSSLPFYMRAAAKGQIAWSNGKSAEKIVEQKLRSLGFTVKKMDYASSFDLLCQDKRVEVKWAGPNVSWHWQINFHRHGVLNESSVDVYIVVLSDIPGCKLMPIYLVIPAPVGRSTINFSIASLIRRYYAYVDNWRILGEPQRIGPYVRPPELSLLAAELEDYEASTGNIEQD